MKVSTGRDICSAISATLAEESTPTDLEAPGRWVLDPLDGTTNYVHDVPLYCVSVGLQIDGEMVVGVVYDPMRDELFSADDHDMVAHVAGTYSLPPR